ncbi:MAG: shikimate dehydrogenase [Verrucomicrobiae bacterium]|nr:shikimate dehydrogenase [Verrucomicrobiae bacterium]
MDISGHTEPYAVLGHPIGHTLSPVMHNAAFAALGRDAIYLAFDVAPEALMTTLAAMADMGFRGVNLTIPLKETAFQGLDTLEASATLLGAVNTVEFSPTGRIGHNTDGYGFQRAVKEAFSFAFANRHVFVVGAGGAGRAVALVAAMEGAARVSLADVDPQRAERAAKEIQARFPAVEAHAAPINDDLPGQVRPADLVVQATPVGMKPGDPSILPETAFRADQCVFDLIYMYPETPVMKVARRAGATTANGLDMLLYQGVRAFEIWTGLEPPVATMRNALKERVYAS